MSHATTDLYARALHSVPLSGDDPHWYARYDTGVRRPLGGALQRWCGDADATDLRLLARAEGTVLDVGCGPGRLVAALARRGRQAAGVDTSPAAIRIARGSGAAALRGSLFDPLPGEGAWDTVLLADGNIGIGGDPTALLRRCLELIGPRGCVLTELDPPGTGLRCGRIRLERGHQRGEWFDWAHVGADRVAAPAADAGLRVREIWKHGGRWFAALVPGRTGTAPPGAVAADAPSLGLAS